MKPLDLDILEGWMVVTSELPWTASRPRKRVHIKDARGLYVEDGYGFRRVEDAMAVAPCMSALPALVRIAKAAMEAQKAGDGMCVTANKLRAELRAAGLLGEETC